MRAHGAFPLVAGSLRPDSRARREVTKSGMLMLPFAPSSAGIARRRLVSDLVEAGIAETAISDAAVVISELFSNALQHAKPLNGAKILVWWQLEPGNVRVFVKDGGGPTMPELGQLRQLSTGGRGLRIVARLSRSWGTRCDDEGTTVWADVEVNRSFAPVRTAAGLVSRVR
jgi:anti-sigma regulatory factor (Ser/Thr protein kinase)